LKDRLRTSVIMTASRMARGKRRDQLEKADGEGVGQNVAEIIIGEKLDEVLEADPFAGEDTRKALLDAVFLERDDDARHGQVVENQQIGQTAPDENLEGALFPEKLPFPGAALPLFHNPPSLFPFFYYNFGLGGETRN
jgi:hypothetical protein